MWIGAQAERASPAPADSATDILLSGALPLDVVRALARGTPRGVDRRRPAERSRPRVAALRNLWITTDAAERAAVLDWQRASYVLYQGLGWTVAESDAGAAMDFAGDAARAIETAVATTIIGSVDEVIDGLREVAAAGVDDVVLRIAVEGAPQAAIHTRDARLRRGRVPGARRRRGRWRAPRCDARAAATRSPLAVGRRVASGSRSSSSRPHRGNRSGDRRDRRGGDVDASA